MSIFIAILIFGIIVLVHEFGHFIVARKCGILVEEFAIGMGPKIVGVKPGETLYSIRLLPLGGYCKMLGEDAESDDKRAFSNKTVAQRMAVASAGAIMNFLLAFAIFFVISLCNGMSLPVVEQVVEGSPAQQAGLMPGDRFVEIDGVSIHIYDDVSFIISDNKTGAPMEIKIKRESQIFTKNITPYYDKEQSGYKVGFRPSWKTGLLGTAQEGYDRAGLWETISDAFFTMLFLIKITLLGLTRLVTMRLSLNDLAGPIGIVQAIGTTYEAVAAKETLWVTIATMASFTGMMSANLGVFNLLPLPALDGGRLAFLTVEGIRKKPVDPDKEGLVHLVGFVLLMVFAVFIAFNDIKKLL